MLTRFFTPSEITNYFERHELKEDLLNGGTIAICSIADLLNVCEAHKKGKLKILYPELHIRFDTFDRDPEGPVRKGIVSVIDLGQYNLSSALFERDNGVVIDLWRKAVNSDISPRRSIRYLTLRIIDDSTWWSENVYQEIEDYHSAQDE